MSGAGCRERGHPPRGRRSVLLVEMLNLWLGSDRGQHVVKEHILIVACTPCLLGVEHENPPVSRVQNPDGCDLIESFCVAPHAEDVRVHLEDLRRVQLLGRAREMETSLTNQTLAVWLPAQRHPTIQTNTTLPS
eukprot:1182868-Prorocentrum_minimum.AAC.2